MSDKVIFKLAEAFAPEIPGIPWDALESQFKATAAQLIYDTQPTADGKTPMGVNAVHLVMLDAHKRAMTVVSTIDLPWEVGTKEAIAAWQQVKKEAISVGDAALSAYLQDFYAVVGANNAMKVPVENLRAIVANLYMSAMYGAVLQTRLVMQKTGQPSEKIIQQIDQVTKAFNAIVFLDSEGVLNALKKKPAGTGAIQIPVIIGTVVAIAAAAGIAAIAWTMVATEKISANNKAMGDICAQATATKDEHLLAACVELSSINKVATDGGPEFGMDTITKYLMLGGGLYLLVLFGPALARAYANSQDRTFGAR